MSMALSVTSESIIAGHKIGEDELQLFRPPSSATDHVISILPYAWQQRWRQLLATLSIEAKNLIARLLHCDDRTRHLYCSIAHNGQSRSAVDSLTPGLQKLPDDVWQSMDEMSNKQRWDLRTILAWFDADV